MLITSDFGEVLSMLIYYKSVNERLSILLHLGLLLPLTCLFVKMGKSEHFSQFVARGVSPDQLRLLVPFKDPGMLQHLRQGFALSSIFLEEAWN